jgi:hypothetical protein
MINAEFLANCSDEQIEQGVAWIKCKGTSFDPSISSYYRFFSCIDNRIYFHGTHFEPCYRPNDIMPIAFANKIALIPLSDNNNEIGMSTFNGDWKAMTNESNDGEFGFDCKFYESISDNPLRAICEVYILMSVAK